MNGLLERAVNGALTRLGRDRIGDWHRVVLVNNEVSISGAARLEGDDGRGFNLLLLSEAGESRYYVRVRDARDPVAAREGALLQQLAAIEGVRGYLPESVTVFCDGIMVHAARYLEGTLLVNLLPRMTLREWQDTVAVVLGLAREICQLSRIALPPLPEGPTLDLHAAAAPSLAALGVAGVGPDRIAALGNLLRRGPAVVQHPQHGDFWPGNILRQKAGWKFLDFEHFGRVTAPLYDACQLLHTSVDGLSLRRRRLTRTTLCRLQANDTLAQGFQAVLAREAGAYRLSSKQALAAVVFWLVDMSARMIRHRVGEDNLLPLLREVDAVADAANSPDLASVYFGAGWSGAR